MEESGEKVCAVGRPIWGVDSKLLSGHTEEDVKEGQKPKEDVSGELCVGGIGLQPVR